MSTAHGFPQVAAVSNKELSEEDVVVIVCRVVGCRHLA